MGKGEYKRKHSAAWTDDQILEALYLRDEGFSMNEIGRHFGVTKNAAIGMINRVLNASNG